MHQVTAESDRASRGVPAQAVRAASPSDPSASADTSPLNTTASASAVSPLSSTTRRTQPSRTAMSRTPSPNRKRAPCSSASRCMASAVRRMPPFTYHTPSCSTCATSISVAGASHGEQPQ